jgi:sec-independent protein translocase protein TatB
VFGLTFEKLLVIGVIAVFLVGPERLPRYSALLARFVRSLRDMATGAKERLKEELGEDFDEDEWKKLDPRQYDPRRIIREALLDDAPASPKNSTPLVAPPIAESAYVKMRARREAEAATASGATPFDIEAT